MKIHVTNTDFVPGEEVIAIIWRSTPPFDSFGYPASFQQAMIGTVMSISPNTTVITVTVGPSRKSLRITNVFKRGNPDAEAMLLNEHPRYKRSVRTKK